MKITPFHRDKRCVYCHPKFPGARCRGHHTNRKHGSRLRPNPNDELPYCQVCRHSRMERRRAFQSQGTIVSGYTLFSQQDAGYFSAMYLIKGNFYFRQSCAISHRINNILHQRCSSRRFYIPNLRL